MVKRTLDPKDRAYFAVAMAALLGTILVLGLQLLYGAPSRDMGATALIGVVVILGAAVASVVANPDT